MAVANPGFNNRNSRVVHDIGNEPRAATRDHDIDESARGQEFGDRVVGIAGYELDGISRHLEFGEHITHHVHQSGIAQRSG